MSERDSGVWNDLTGSGTPAWWNNLSSGGADAHYLSQHPQLLSAAHQNSLFSPQQNYLLHQTNLLSQQTNNVLAHQTNSPSQQLFNYKMAAASNNFPTPLSPASSTDSVSVRGYDYSINTMMNKNYEELFTNNNMLLNKFSESVMKNMDKVPFDFSKTSECSEMEERHERSREQDWWSLQHSPLPSPKGEKLTYQQRKNLEHIQQLIQNSPRNYSLQSPHSPDLPQSLPSPSQASPVPSPRTLHSPYSNASLSSPQTNLMPPSPQSSSSHMKQKQFRNSTPTPMLTPVPSPAPPIIVNVPIVKSIVRRMPRGKNDSKPRGRMTAYAFFVQTCREEHKKKHPDENVVFAEFSKKCAERWKTMLDKEKRRFHEMAEKDKLRYDSEMQNYIPPKGEKRGKKRKHIKDPNAPKRSLSAFFWFCNDERPKVKAINPEFGVGDVAKELGRRWAEADPDTKSKYEAMAEKDKARYDREMTAYKKKPKSSAEDDDDEDVDEDEEEDEDE